MSIKNKNEKISFRESIGVKRQTQQILDTINFELQRSTKRFLILTGVIIIFIALTNIIVYFIEKTFPTEWTPIDFLTNYYNVSFLGLIILVLAITYGGKMLVADFHEFTGNILFPKISRGRLMTGRMIANYIMIAAQITFYYAVWAIITLIRFEEVPNSLWLSFMGALLYGFMLLSYVVFFSSFMKTSAISIVISLVIWIIALPIIMQILSLLIQIEPLFLPNYYGTFIGGALNMPEERFLLIEVPDIITVKTWLTPTTFGAIIGMLGFSAAFLGFAYWIYRNRQNK
ncbi:MAG: ABC transporter permease [Promethearchaeota archaeon]